MLLTIVDQYMRRTRISASRFGVEAVGDPQFVFQLRLGRRPRPATVRRVMDYVDRHPMVDVRSSRGSSGRDR